MGASPNLPSERRLSNFAGNLVGMEKTVDGGTVIKTLALPGTDDVVVLLDPERRPEGVLPWHPFQNVLRVSPSGDISWRADLMPGETAAKCWYDVDFDGVLRAMSYSYQAVLDAKTGRITESTFTK